MSTATAVDVKTTVSRVDIRRLADLGYGYMPERGFRHILCKEVVGPDPANAYRHEDTCEVKQLNALGLILRPRDDEEPEGAPRRYTCTVCTNVVTGDPFEHARQKCPERR